MNHKPFDLIIVGAGVLGTFHAYHAARTGRKVLLLEKDNRPVGATVRNFGQVVPSGLAGRWFDYGRRTLDIYAELQAKTDLSLRRNGSIYVASDEDEWTLANELFDRRRAQGYPVELLSAAQTFEKYPLLRPDYVRGALWFPGEYSVEPDRFIHRLIDYVVQAHGVTYRPNAAAIGLDAGDGGASVTLAGGETLRSERVLVCSGHEFRLLFPQLFAESNLVVSKLHMLRTVPERSVSLPGNILTGLTIRRYEAFAECPSFAHIQTPPHLVELTQWGIHILFKQALDGSIILGDSHEYAPAARVDDLGFGLNEHLNRLMRAEAERIVQFPLGPTVESWAGVYAQTPDEIFEHDVDDRIRIVTGIGGKGMSSSAGFAEESVTRWLGA